jgi:eukaryotic-like serine/threonine-protein kinase
MSMDTSRQITVRSGEPSNKNGDSSTLKPGSKRNAEVQKALHGRVVPSDKRVSAMTLQPGSGRPEAARLPIVEKEVYRIEGEVAQGGIGRVLSARDERLDRTVAVKVLLEDSGAYEDRFVREALVTARLQHPSIVPVYEAGRWPTGEPFYSMKLVSGKPLLDIIEETRSLDDRLPLLTRVLAVADAMAYAHERRIIHRDLKPANILVGAHGETVLIDWGLAKDLNEANAPCAAELAADPNAKAPENNALTMVGSVMGTPAYMPPEQAAGDHVDERADVYALGSILYHVLSGKQPYSGYSGMQTIMRVLEEPPKALQSLQVGIPRDLLAIIEKAMHRERDARYPTAKEFADDLRRYLTGQLVGAHQYSS